MAQKALKLEQPMRTETMKLKDRKNAIKLTGDSSGAQPASAAKILPSEPPRNLPELSDAAAITLRDIYDRLDVKPFREAIAVYAGLADLLIDNNSPEACAIRQMVEAENVLNALRTRCHEM